MSEQNGCELTDKDIGAINHEAHRIANDLANSTEGHFNPRDMEGIFQDADREIAQAAQRKLIAVVDEWVFPMRDSNDLRELGRAFEEFNTKWQALRKGVGLEE